AASEQTIGGFEHQSRPAAGVLAGDLEAPLVYERQLARGGGAVAGLPGRGLHRGVELPTGFEIDRIPVLHDTPRLSLARRCATAKAGHRTSRQRRCRERRYSALTSSTCSSTLRL